MIQRKIQNLSFVKQGAVNGFLLGILIQVLFIHKIYYEVTHYLNPELHCGEADCPSITQMIDYNLLFLSPILSLIVALSCFVVHKFWSGKIKSQIYLWVLVSLFTTIFVYIYSTTYNFINEYVWECWEVPYESCKNADFISHLQIDWLEMIQYSIAFSIFLAFNLLFAFVINRKKSVLS